MFSFIYPNQESNTLNMTHLYEHRRIITIHSISAFAATTGGSVLTAHLYTGYYDGRPDSSVVDTDLAHHNRQGFLPVCCIHYNSVTMITYVAQLVSQPITSQNGSGGIVVFEGGFRLNPSETLSISLNTYPNIITVNWSEC